MRDRDDKMDGEDEAAEEDVIALHAIAAMLEVDGDDELAWAQREALAAIGNEALVLKARREEEDRRMAADRRARRRARRREEERRAAREEAARVETARRERAAREAEEARAQARIRTERRERARRQEEARRADLRRRRIEERRRAAPARHSPAVGTQPSTPRVDRSTPPEFEKRPTGAKVQPRHDVEHRSGSPPALKEPDRFHQAEQPPLTGTDLANWRSRLGLTQQAAADRLGVRQGTISKAEGRQYKALGPAVQAALASVLAEAP